MILTSKLTDDRIREVISPIRSRDIATAVAQIQAAHQWITYSPWHLSEGVVSLTHVKNNICKARITNPKTGNSEKHLFDYFREQTDFIFIIQTGYSFDGGDSNLSRIAINPTIQVDSTENILKIRTDYLDGQKREKEKMGIKCREVIIPIDQEILRKMLVEEQHKALRLYHEFEHERKHGGKAKAKELLRQLGNAQRGFLQLDMIRIACEANEGNFRHVEYEHPLGRETAAGFSLQSLSSKLRKRLFINCEEFDINACAQTAIHQEIRTGDYGKTNLTKRIR